MILIYTQFAIALLWAMLRPGVPSAISVARFASVWYLPELMHADYRLTFLIVAFGAALSDWVDGEVARRMGLSSTTGGFFDLLGDKGLTITLMYLGWGVWGSVWWYLIPCTTLVVYHVVVMGLRFVDVVRPKSSRIAKTKFFVEISGLIGCFASFSLGYLFVWLDWLGLFTVWLAAAFAVWSMLEYLGLVPDLPERYYPRKWT